MKVERWGFNATLTRGVAVLAVAAGAACGQTTRFVGGTNTPNYSTIPLAIAASGDGDTICIETNVVTSSGIAVNKPNLTFVGKGPANTIVQAHADYDAANNRVFYVMAAATNATFRDMTIRHGKVAASGAGIAVYQASVVVSNCLITRNRATAGNGGGVNIDGTGGRRLTIRGSTISDNECSGTGGGICGNSSFELLLDDSTLSGNASVNYGGGLAFYLGSTGVVANCTIYGNRSSYTNPATVFHGGGGVDAYPMSGRSLAFYNCTIVSNSIPTGSGGGICQYGNVTVESTLIAGNTASNGCGPNFRRLSGTLTERYNFVESNADAAPYFSAGQTNANGSYIGTAAAPLDPRLLPPADNGGQTRTCALQEDSPAISHGSNPLGLLYDQRGARFDRVIGERTDIGAFEYGAGAPEGALYMLR